MKIIETVKTESKAKEILEANGFQLFSKKASCQCECGETVALFGFDKDYDRVAVVGVCEACGDDEASQIDVLNV
tara:strand:- start:648 stop:869 length:222 start_codon:yes stop_codon:yes gene_type:complete